MKRAMEVRASSSDYFELVVVLMTVCPMIREQRGKEH